MLLLIPLLVALQPAASVVLGKTPHLLLATCVVCVIISLFLNNTLMFIGSYFDVEIRAYRSGVSRSADGYLFPVNNRLF